MDADITWIFYPWRQSGLCQRAGKRFGDNLSSVEGRASGKRTGVYAGNPDSAVPIGAAAGDGGDGRSGEPAESGTCISGKEVYG